MSCFEGPMSASHRLVLLLFLSACGGKGTDPVGSGSPGGGGSDGGDDGGGTGGDRDSGSAGDGGSGSTTTDADGDGYGVEDGDCDDLDAAVFPGASSYESIVPGYFEAMVATSAGQPVAADLDLDGLVDLLVPSDDQVLLLWGAAQGQFVDGDPIGAGAAVARVVLADLRGDASPDLVLSREDGVIEVHLGDGLGGFSDPLEMKTTCGVSTGLVAGDLDLDGHTDLVVGCSDPAALLLHSDGKGGFVQGALTPGHAASEVGLSDLDGDGLLDVVMAGDASAAITVWHAEGDGSYTALELELVEVNEVLVLADADLDGDTDIIVGHRSDPDLVWYRNDGERAYSRRASGWGGGLFGDGTMQLAAVDSDGDGQPELYAGTDTLGTYAWDLGTDGPSFLSETTWADTVNWLVGADIDGDGLVDVVTANRGGTVQVRRSLGAEGAMQPSAHVGWRLVNAMATGDLNGDGYDDLAVANENGEAGWFLGGASGSLEQAGEAGFESFTNALCTLDVDGDGRQELVSTDGWDTLQMWSFDDAGALLLSTTIRIAGASSNMLAAADMDSDGDDDLVVGWRPSGDDGFAVAWNEGGELLIGEPSSSTDYVHTFAVGDLTGDGLPDVVLSAYTDSVVEVWRNVRPDKFDLIYSSKGRTPTAQIRIADLDGNGTNDLLLGDESNMDLRVLSNGGDGTSWTESSIPVSDTNSSLSNLAVADADQDGDLDIFAGSPNSGVSVLLGDGVGGFVHTGSLPGPALVGSSSILAFDHEGDGDVDIAWSDGNEGVRVFSNICEG
jgi:FG-GAP-like repeat